jgi:hypothetical protein
MNSTLPSPVPFYRCSRRGFISGALALTVSAITRSEGAQPKISDGRYLYVSVPSLGRQMDRGGRGVLVFDIDQNHKFVRRIESRGLSADGTGKPLSTKGIVASEKTSRFWVSTTEALMSFDLLNDKLLWEKSFEGGCDRMALSPDGRTMYLPSFEKDHWHVINALTGEIIKRLDIKCAAHNTIFGPDGKRVYMSGIASPLLHVADAKDHSLLKPVGPFGHFVRPFTVNAAQTLCFVNVNELLGFEVGDLKTGKALHRIEVQGYKTGPVKRHKCPSHGIALTPNEKEIWLCDSFNQRLHVFDVSAMNAKTPPRQVATIALQRDEPGWITFSIDGRFAYPSTLEIVDVASRKIVTGLQDERGEAVLSEKVMEIDFRGGHPARVGDQFGIGRGISGV